MVKIKPEVAILITAEPKSAKYGKVFGPKPSDHLVRLYVNVKFNGQAKTHVIITSKIQL